MTRCAAGPRWAARCRVLSRARITADTNPPCVLASHSPIAPRPGERAEELVVAPDALPRDDARDKPLALRLWQPLLHVNNYAGFGAGVAGKDLAMLRKLLWTGLYASFAAGATM